MADTGQPWTLPYPLLTDLPNGPVATQDLAVAVHAGLGHAYPCTAATRPAHTAGFIIFETDTGFLQISDGTDWVQLGYGDDTGWVDAVAVSWTAAANFSITSGVVRRRNGVAGLYLNMTSTNAITAGDIANVQVAQAPAGYTPGQGVGGLAGGSAGPGLQGYVGNGGQVYMTSLSTNLGAGGAFAITGTYML